MRRLRRIAPASTRHWQRRSSTTASTFRMQRRVRSIRLRRFRECSRQVRCRSRQQHQCRRSRQHHPHRIDKWDMRKGPASRRAFLLQSIRGVPRSGASPISGTDGNRAASSTLSLTRTRKASRTKIRAMKLEIAIPSRSTPMWTPFPIIVIPMSKTVALNRTTTMTASSASRNDRITRLTMAHRSSCRVSLRDGEAQPIAPSPS